MADISVIQLPSGSSYNIKDAWARQAIEGLGNPTHFLGASSTTITDGGTQKPIIGGDEITPHAGDIVVYSNGEFIWSGTTWIELGDLSGLGDLAYKDSASGSITPTGTVSKPTFTGSSSNNAQEEETMFEFGFNGFSSFIWNDYLYSRWYCRYSNNFCKNCGQYNYN